MNLEMSKMVMQSIKQWHDFTGANPMPQDENIVKYEIPSHVLRKELGIYTVYSPINGSILDSPNNWDDLVDCIYEHQSLIDDKMISDTLARWRCIISLPEGIKPWAVAGGWDIIEKYGNITVWGADRPFDSGY